MRILLALSLLLFVPLFAEENYENYTPQTFFDSSDIDSFFQSETGELLKKLIVHGKIYYMQQDGDLYDEDVATIEDPIFSARESLYSFARSKRLLATKIYPSHPKAFYSNCDYTIQEKRLIPIHKSCGFHYRKNKKRSQRIEWEHIVPAWHFGHQLRCWQNGGRMNCRETNSKFRQMEADMHNLVPAIGEINGDRSNFKYGMIEGELRLYGKVDMEIAFKEKRAEPRPSIYGDIARTYFYMRDRYGLKISKSQEKMLIAWNNLDPVSPWERKKNQLIKSIQGDENPYITNYKKIKQLGDTPALESTLQDIKEELQEEYGAILAQLSPPIAGIVLFVMSLVTLWYRRKNKKQPKEERLQSKTSMIISKLGNVALSINDKEEIIIEKADPNNPNQQWLFTKANKKKAYFFIENPHRGGVIEIANSDSNDGAKIILNKKKSRKNDHQEWKLESSKDQGYVFILNRWSLNVLDIKRKQTTDGTKVQSFHKKIRGTENQEWQIMLTDQFCF
jgi:deoxyribonuclease-1